MELRKKLKNQKSREWNSFFKNNQSRVFSKFKDIIESEKGCELPVFKEIVKERKYFEKPEEVIEFWKSLWCKEDKGNPETEWLREYERLFEEKIPEINTDDIEIEEEDITNAIKKKRNWSAPGPDLIVNFWLKRISVIRMKIKIIFMKIINAMFGMKMWYYGGRTFLLEKLG